MRSKSLKSIVQPFVLKSVEPATVNSIRDAIFENVKWNSDGKMLLRRREWSEIFTGIQAELKKLNEEFSNAVVKLQS